MTSCSAFRNAFAPGTSNPALVEHLRSCDACLDFAAHVDPDVMFRALGGDELVPPGGVDAFVDGVMHAVQLREREGQLAAPVAAQSWTRRLATAAALVAGVTGATLVYRAEVLQRPASQPVAVVAAAHMRQISATKPIIETYSSANATIMEVPSEGPSDVKIVMVIDENLPADL